MSEKRYVKPALTGRTYPSVIAMLKGEGFSKETIRRVQNAIRRDRRVKMGLARKRAT